MRPSAPSVFRPIVLAAVLLLAALGAWALTGPVTAFSGAFDGVDARLRWEVGSEAGLQRFELARRVGNDPIFHDVVTLTPDGSRTYEYLDQNPHRTNDEALHSCSYKLTAVTTSGSHDYAVTLAQSPSAVQRSWGSIKSMFR